jgi:hypothetical protein
VRDHRHELVLRPVRGLGRLPRFVELAGALELLVAELERRQIRRDLGGNDREEAEIPLLVGVAGAPHEQDPYHLVEAHERNGEVRAPRPGESSGRPRLAQSGPLVRLREELEHIAERRAKGRPLLFMGRELPRVDHFGHELRRHEESALEARRGLEERASIVRHDSPQELERAAQARLCVVHGLEEARDLVEGPRRWPGRARPA